MAGPKGRRGFTLVELLVVITIIGMLVSLLLPAIQSARETGRKNTCMNNMRNASTALMQVHDTKRAFPGYANVVGGKRASWVVTILNNLDRGDLYQVWLNNKLTTAATAPPTPTFAAMMPVPPPTGVPYAHSQLNILVCPSNPSTATAPDPLSYVVNSGSALTSTDNYPGGANLWKQDIASGVFFNQALSDPTAPGPTQYNPTGSGGGQFSTTPGPKVSMDFITTNDGASYTLMVSENLQAGNWATDPTVTTPGAAPNPPYQSDFQLRQNTTFVWYVNGMYNNAEATPPPYPGVKINALARTATTPLVYPITMMNNDGLGYSRPSSAHPGGVNVMFCDGHNRFISEDIQYNVYTQLMTPRQNAIQITAAGATPSTVMPPWNYLISETDY